MVRTTTANNQTCVDCKAAARTEGPRCLTCHRARRAAAARKQRKQKRIERLAQNPQLMEEGKRICAKCLKLRQLSEYRTSQPKRQGKLNKICDQCLCQAYSYKGSGLDYKYWRRRAYTVNTAARIRLAAKLCVPAKQIKLTDLQYECKPQDLQGMYEKEPLCFFCQVELTCNNLAVDHLIPASRGGADALDNLALCCRDCNHLKHTRTGEEFAAFIRDYAARLMKVVEQQDKQPAG